MKRKFKMLIAVSLIVIILVVSFASVVMAAGPNGSGECTGDCQNEDCVGLQLRGEGNEDCLGPYEGERGNSWGEYGEGTGPGLERCYGKNAH